MIKLEKINKIYQDNNKTTNCVQALKDVSIEIESGKLTAIIGPSGSGKSTLLNVIGSLDRPTSGTIIIDNVTISDLTDNQLCEFRNKHIGFIFQSYFLDPTFSVLENVCMPLTITGVKKSVREKAAKEVLVKLGLEDKISSLAKNLSGGEKQRVSIARALVTNPQIILADEPTGNLDSKTGDEVIKILKDLASEGKAVILVTHNLEYAKLCDRIIKISDGVATSIDSVN